jgi:hypothetical protein
MSAPAAERLVTRLAVALSRRSPSRRGFLAAATMTGTALAVDPWNFLLRPQSAYASACGADSRCSDGYSAFCCSINHGHNTCPPGSFAGGWWKADRSRFCGGAARYYIDCNAKPGTHFHCHCNKTNCDHRRVACNIFRYGQCNTDIPGTTAVVCRMVSCLPPWKLYPKQCGKSSATDNNTAGQTAPCLTRKNTHPNLVTFAKARHELGAGHRLGPGERLVSPDRHTECVMRKDGNFVLRNERGVLWSTATARQARGGHLLLRHDGDLVVLDKRGNVRWSSGKTHAGSQPVLRLLDDGRLAVFDDHKIIWHTRTHTP